MPKLTRSDEEKHAKVSEFARLISDPDYPKMFMPISEIHMARYIASKMSEYTSRNGRSSRLTRRDRHMFALGEFFNSWRESVESPEAQQRLDAAYEAITPQPDLRQLIHDAVRGTGVS